MVRTDNLEERSVIGREISRQLDIECKRQKLVTINRYLTLTFNGTLRVGLDHLPNEPQSGATAKSHLIGL